MTLGAVCAAILIVVIAGFLYVRDGKTDTTEAEVPSLENAYEVGSEIRFGTYEQDGDSANGKEDIEWIVLDKKYGKVLLLSKYCLDFRPYDEDGKGGWENCSLRGWLNKEFFEDPFSEEEQAQICKTTSGKRDVRETVDQVFLLERPKVREYFFTSEESKASPTEYARERGGC